MPKKNNPLSVSSKQEALTPVMVGLTILGKPMSKIAGMLDVDIDTVRKYLDSKEAKNLIEPFRHLIVMAHGKAEEALFEDVSYKGENVALLQLRQKAALKILQSTGIIPKEGGGDHYLLQQNNYFGDARDDDFRKVAMAFLGIGTPPTEEESKPAEKLS
ncbi:MAG: hypothetical protein WC405_21525 [Syntrophales bacterium]